jgi:hypothetical protein
MNLNDILEQLGAAAGSGTMKLGEIIERLQKVQQDQRVPRLL